MMISALLLSCTVWVMLTSTFIILSPDFLISGMELVKVKVKVAQSCLTLCDPMDYTVHGIL